MNNMKKCILFLFVFFPNFCMSQVTEMQKQEALSTAKRFCTLMSQFSNGGSGYLENDKKIFLMCSTPKISAFDDISSNKEIMLNAYMALITKTYKNRLQMDFSNPVVSEVFYVPQFNISMEYASIFNGGDQGTMSLKIRKTDYSDIYIIINVSQSMPTLYKTTKRYIVYSIVEKKIISFSNTNSPYVLYCKALDCYSKQKYQDVLSYCDKVLVAERFDRKSDCAVVAMHTCFLMQDYNAVSRYIKYYNGEYKSAFLTLIDFVKAIQADDVEKAVSCAKIIAESNLPTRYGMQTILGRCYAFGFGGCEKDVPKAIYWYKRAMREGSAEAGYNLAMDFVNPNCDIDEYLTEEELVESVSISASRGYIPAYSLLGTIYGSLGQREEEGNWYKKSAESNDIIGMIYYGCFLSVVKHDTQNALRWLKKAVNDKRFDTFMEYQYFKKKGFKTKEDIQQIIYNIENGIPISLPSSFEEPEKEEALSQPIVSSQPNIPHQTTVVQPQQHPQQHSQQTTTVDVISTTATHSENTGTSSNHHHATPSYRYRKSFNSPSDDYCVAGISIGYVQKSWSYKEVDGGKGKIGFWEGTNHIKGVQAGLRIEPLFKYGFGVNTGLYYEFYYSKSKPLVYAGEEYKPTLQEHALYLPIHLEYRLHFSENFQLFFYGGIGLDYGISATLNTNNEHFTYDDTNAYHGSDWKKFNASLEYGGGIRIYMVQLNFSISKGLVNMSESSEYTMKQNKDLMCGLSVMF